jgi:hypothetical protein
MAEAPSGWPDRVRYNETPGHPMSLKLGTISIADKNCLCRFLCRCIKDYDFRSAICYFPIAIELIVSGICGASLSDTLCPQI